MNITLKEIPIRDLVKDYVNNKEEGVFGYGGKLNIRPPYQREFVYNEKQRNEVINTVINDFPLNTFYWAVNDDGTYEIIDGQQRTISICKYVDSEFTFNGRFYHNLHEEEREQILDYKLMVYFCEGTDKEKLEWFKVINIAGEKLTPQELRNAVYHGSWVSDAKRYFSKSNCPAYQLGGNYIKGSPIRQEILESVIKWRSNNNIEEYMAERQHDPDARELWDYFMDIIDWIEKTFINPRQIMRGLEWGELYNKYKNYKFDPDEIEKQIKELLKDEDVTNHKGIYLYVLSGEEKHLSIRRFNETQRRQTYEKQDGMCVSCGEKFKFEEMHADHIVPWSKGGRTIEDNCQMLCMPCNSSKGDK